MTLQSICLVSFPVCWPICFQNLCWQQIAQVHCICYLKKYSLLSFLKQSLISFNESPLVLVLQDLQNNSLHSLYPLPWFCISWSQPLSPNWSSRCGQPPSFLYAPWEYGTWVWAGLSLRLSLPSAINEQGSQGWSALWDCSSRAEMSPVS